MSELEILEREQAAFDNALKDMLKSHRDEWVVFSDGRPAGFFPTYTDAHAFGVESFGLDTVFFVAQVSEPSSLPVSLSWESGAMFAA